MQLELPSSRHQVPTQVQRSSLPTHGEVEAHRAVLTALAGLVEEEEEAGATAGTAITQQNMQGQLPQTALRLMPQQPPLQQQQVAVLRGARPMAMCLVAAGVMLVLAGAAAGVVVAVGAAGAGAGSMQRRQRRRLQQQLRPLPLLQKKP